MKILRSSYVHGPGQTLGVLVQWPNGVEVFIRPTTLHRFGPRLGRSFTPVTWRLAQV
ncbi:hypothetical protein FHT97_005552 [Rhizobium sp. BK399]|nr:hypothetical protein [Rhizobium sp. BK399]